jgi:hypothetical protein
MKLFWRGFCLLIIAVFFWFGVRLANQLWVANNPASAFIEVPGNVVEVIRRVVSDLPGRDAEHLAELQFAYSYAGNTYRSNTFSPLCTYCAPQDVFNTIGERPSLINPGRIVKVFVKRSDPKVAYLNLPNSSELVKQLLFTLLFLLVGPAFAYWMFRQIGKPFLSADGERGCDEKIGERRGD